MSYPYGQTIALVTRTVTGVDSDGNDVFTDANTTLHNIPVWPRDANGTSGNELVQGQDMVIVGVAALLPPGTDAGAVDRVVWRGDTYEIVGEPGFLQSPFTGWQPGVVVALKRVTG